MNASNYSHASTGVHPRMDLLSRADVEEALDLFSRMLDKLD